MTVALPCPHGMPNAATCLDCMEDGPVTAPATWAKVGHPFISQYRGDCPGCPAGINPPARVQRWDRSDGSRTAYTHDGCTP